MSKRAKIDSLSIEITAIMEEYASDVAKDMKEDAKEIAKKAANELKKTSPVGVGAKGHYKDGWVSKVKFENTSSIGISIHNRKKPGLTHLLEKGHAKRGGGRVDGIPHIVPVEKKAIEEYEKRLKERLSR